jgi:PQQ-dependent dehydrogenase (methanol/ethanol family)
MGMRRITATGLFTAGALTAVVGAGMAQTADFKPVTRETLMQPAPGDWLMINRTYDEQRFSPLSQINRDNVAQLRLAWSRGLPAGTQESTPIVYNGVLYSYRPGAGVLALNATNGDQLWEYTRTYPKEMAEAIGGPTAARSKSLAIFEDMIYYDAPDGFIIALDARTGKVRWETKAHDYKQKTQHTGGLIVAEGKVISNRTCETRAGCFISAHDARTGAEVWKLYTTEASNEPGGDSWGKIDDEKRVASSWGLPGSYDPERKLVYWAIANPKPYTRLGRYGSAEAVAKSSPAELYSNSTVALDVETGKLKWYYQHLPGDDWDADHIHERTLVRAPFNPDPKSVKWINPKIKRGEMRDMVIAVGEAGGIFALDRDDGQFLWASPFPYDVPEFNISNIDVETGRVDLNWDKVFKKDGDRITACFHNVRSFWSTAYHPTKNALYVPFNDNCLDMTANAKNPQGFGPRRGILRPGAKLDEYMGMAKIDLSTGEMKRIHTQAVPGNGSALVTAGDLLFWGDMNRRFRAFDADSGKILWELPVGGIVQTSTISYAVDGKQFIAIYTGDAQSGTAGPLQVASSVRPPRAHNAIYVFALP